MLYKKQIAAAVLVTLALVFAFGSQAHLFPIKTERETSTNSSTQNSVPSGKISTKQIISFVKPIETPYITEYPLPNGTGPNSILVDREGIVWTVGSTLHVLFRFNPKTGELQQYQIPGESGNDDRMSWSMLEDKEGFVWFSQFGPDPLWRFDSNSDRFTSFHSLTAPPFQMKLDAKTGNMWFTTLTEDSLGLIQKIQNSGNPHTDYKVDEFSIGNETYPSGLAPQGGSVWVTELQKGKIAKFEPIHDNSTGEITGIKKIEELPTANGTLFYAPTDILFSDNNTAWITEHGSSTIDRFDIKSQHLTRIPTAQNGFHVASLPFWMRQSIDGSGIWFDEHEGGSIAFLDTNNNTLTEYKLQNASQVVYMLNLALDTQDPGKAWFSEWNADRIGVVDRTTIPFDIHSDKNEILWNGKEQKNFSIGIEIKKEQSVLQGQHLVSLNVSSSMTPDGELENMTANFSQNSVDLSNSGQPIHDILTLHNESVQPGNYTLGISAGNDLVTKTIFYELTVR